MRFAGKTILLGVTGGIAAYKSPEVLRALRQEGARVRVVLTYSAQEFVTPLTLQTLAGEPVATELFDLTQESEIGHIRLADTADAVLVAPATANVVGKLAAGIADDLLTTVLLATRAPVVLAPAMNVHMYENRLVQENLARLAGLGWRIVEPESGPLACGYEGAGRLPEAEILVEEVAAALAVRDLVGESVLVTAGPTREHLDPVRFLSNRSSGKMGYALARAAARRGARVTLISGPTSLPDPRHVTVVRVESAEEMASSVAHHAADTTLVIAAAAVADYRPTRREAEKQPKASGRTRWILETTPDIVGDVLPRSLGRLVVGFAAETKDVIARARAKLQRKTLDLIVANDVLQAGAGFDVDTNVVSLVDASSVKRLPLLGKDEVADAIFDHVRKMRIAQERSAPVRARSRSKPRARGSRRR